MFALATATLLLGAETPGRSILVFSKTAGYRHDSIPAATRALQQEGSKRGWAVAVSEDSAVFSPQQLSKYDCVVFALTTGDVLNGEQERALSAFIAGGGGYVGIHAAADTEYDWPWYGRLVGAYFLSHPAIQDAVVRVEDRRHPSMSFLPNPWKRSDEWYDYRESPRSRVRVLANLDAGSYTGSKMVGDHPITWCQEFEGGRSWYTGMGHTAESYGDPLFVRMIAEGIEWASARSRRSVPDGFQPVVWDDKLGWNASNGVYANSGEAPEPLLSTPPHGDVELHVEFRIPKGSNSGIYLQGRYEVQIFDSSGKADRQLTFADCGGIYQRWRDEKGIEGRAPSVNAFKGPGEWNAFDIRFQAPKFDRAGKKTANARFLEVRLNGRVIHRNAQVTGPTRAALIEGEAPTGPLYLQADHGTAEFRNVRWRPIGKAP